MSDDISLPERAAYLAAMGLFAVLIVVSAVVAASYYRDAIEAQTELARCKSAEAAAFSIPLPQSLNSSAPFWTLRME